MAADLGFLSDKGPVDDRTAAQWAYETLKASFPNIRGEPALQMEKKTIPQSPSKHNKHRPQADLHPQISA